MIFTQNNCWNKNVLVNQSMDSCWKYNNCQKRHFMIYSFREKVILNEIFELNSRPQPRSWNQASESTQLVRPWCFIIHYYFATSRTNWVQICTGLLFYAYEIHQLRKLAFDNYQRCPVFLKQQTMRFKLQPPFVLNQFYELESEWRTFRNGVWATGRTTLTPRLYNIKVYTAIRCFNSHWVRFTDLKEKWWGLIKNFLAWRKQKQEVREGFCVCLWLFKISNMHDYF